MSSVDGISGNLAGMQYAVSVAKKTNNYIREQGQALLSLIEASTSVANASGAGAVVSGKGTNFDAIG